MKEIEWIKDMVKVCINNDLSENDKRNRFEELKMRYENFTLTERNLIKKTIKEQFEVNDQIYLYSVLLFYMAKEEFAESVLDALLLGQFDACTGSMLELQTRIYDKVFKNFYQKIRVFHRKNIDRFDENLMIDFPYLDVKSRNKRRIVIVTEQLISISHSPTSVVFRFAYALKKMGYEIILLVCPDNREISEELWYHNGEMGAIKRFFSEPLKISYQEELFVGYQIDMSQVCLKEYHMMLSLIYAWNPYFVLDLGTANPVVDLIEKFTTLVAWEMSISCPVSEAGILIRLGRTDDKLERDYKEALLENQVQLFMEENIPVLVEDSSEQCFRSEMKLPEERFLIAIVGNRLDTDINDTFIAIMQKILDDVSCVDFVIIGEVNDLKMKLDDEIFQNRVYYLGYQELMKVYSILDLYLNPDRLGGGFSSAMALIAGLPVVTLPNCDVAYNVGEEFVVSDYEEMMQTIKRYVSDKKFYEHKAEQAHSYKEKNTDAKMERYVKILLDKVIRKIEGMEQNDAGI